MTRVLRLVWRLLGFCAIALCCCLDFLLRIWLTGRAGNRHLRTAWTHTWGKAFMRLLNLRITVHGEPPRSGLLACNHLSYIDIVALAACRPLVFVSKSEVRWWPVVGQLTLCAGTLFINREQRSDVKRMAEAFAPIIEGGSVVTLFPEGTSTGGDRVLPFHSSLFEPAASRGWDVAPAWIGYEVPGGDASEEVAYWKDMTFLPHLLHLFTLPEVRTFVRFGPVLPRGMNRKEMARTLHREVCRLAAEAGRTLLQGIGAEPAVSSTSPAAGSPTAR